VRYPDFHVHLISIPSEFANVALYEIASARTWTEPTNTLPVDELSLE